MDEPTNPRMGDMSEMVERAAKAIDPPAWQAGRDEKPWGDWMDRQAAARIGARAALLAALDPKDEALVEAGAIAAAANELRDEWPEKSLQQAWLLTRERTREYWRNRTRETITAFRAMAQGASVE